MPRVFEQFFDGNNIYACQKCHCHLSNLSELISKAFRGQTGTAYLFNTVVNSKFGPIQQKRLITGVHHVCDLYCAICNDDRAIGWKYVLCYYIQIRAASPSQKYKEGKHILEEAYLEKQQWIDQG